jgi:oligoribonuclease NrnB/cAMP/cGMP phosphodiesterase (DHH superfamily)
MSVVFYHCSDLDGHCSGAVARHFLNVDEMIPFQYGQEVPWDLCRDRNVFMLDVSLPRHDMETMLATARMFTWIDHHDTAIREMEGLDIKGLRRNGDAACELAWEFWDRSGSTPDAVRLLGRWDVWDHEADPRVEVSQYGMRSRTTDPVDEDTFLTVWRPLLEGDEAEVAAIVTDGALLVDYETQYSEKVAGACAFETTFEGHAAVAINRPVANSKTFDSVFDPDVHQLMVLYYRTKRRQWNVSLYTPPGHGPHCGEIAKQFGGGGHAGAAGFQCDELPKALM